MVEKEAKSSSENVYALDANQKEIYILQVPYEERGLRKPYFCLGCGKIMQAIYRKIESERHFRHDVVRQPGEVKCTYNDETYRHKLAKEIVQKVGRIKVPRLLVYHPEDYSATPALIKDCHFIEGNKILIEHYLYENKKGEIVVGNNTDDPYPNDTNNKYLKIKPDAMFLDVEGKPEFIIEFVATHKPDQEKLAKLKRLGINAIQMSVPKGSPADIEMAILTTTRTKWIYNNEIEKADYFQFSKGNFRGVYDSDEDQRKLSEEGFRCRKARLTNLIQSIDRIIRSEPYRNLESELRSEIQRVEGNTKRAESELEDLRNESIERGISEHSERRRALEQRRRALEERRSKFRETTENYEGRYLRKSGELEQQEIGIDEEIRELAIAEEEYYFGGGKTESAYSEVSRKYREEERDLDESIQGLQRKIRLLEHEKEGIRKNIESAPAELERRRGKLLADFNDQIESIERSIEERRERSRSLGESKEAELEGIRIQFHQFIETKDYSRLPGVQQFLNILPKLNDTIAIYQATYEANRKLKGGDR